MNQVANEKQMEHNLNTLSTGPWKKFRTARRASPNPGLVRGWFCGVGESGAGNEKM